MEFNKPINNNAISNTSISSTSADSTIKLKSIFNNSNIYIGDILITSSKLGSILNVTVDTTELINSLSNYTIKTKLITVYDSKGRLFNSTRTIQSFEIKNEQHPITINYKLIIEYNGNKQDYEINYTLPVKESVANVKVYGIQIYNNKDYTLTESVQVIDEQLYDLKKILENNQLIFDSKLKKYIPLPQIISNIYILQSNLEDKIKAIEEKIKDL